MTQTLPVAKWSKRRPSDNGTDQLWPPVSTPMQSWEDAGLTARIRRALLAKGYGGLRAVEVFVLDGIVRLSGQVPSFHLKQIAQVAAIATSGNYRIRNDLKVDFPKEENTI